MHIVDGLDYLDDDRDDSELGFIEWLITKAVADKATKAIAPKPAATPAAAPAAVRAPLPRVQAKSTSDRPRVQASSKKTDGDVNTALVNAVAAAVMGKLDPRLNAINKALGLAENQRIATSEHKFLTDDAAYRKKVLADLMAIAQRLPADHPTRKRTMRVGFMSGLM